MAVELCRRLLRKFGVEESTQPSKLPAAFKTGLEKTVWPGRCQILALATPRPTYYLDGAHTTDSVLVAGKWFAECLSSLLSSTHVTLIFNQQERDAVSLLRVLHSQLPENRKMSAIFCTNTTFKDKGYSPELLSLNADANVVKSFKVQAALKEAWDGEGMGGNSLVAPTIEEAILEAEKHRNGVVFVCGSLHLVGGVVEVLGAEV